jgi:nifR3 family TIM-barrel protein
MPLFRPLRIGTLEIASNLCLAPLAGYTSLAFRLTVREMGGLGLATTEVVSARLLREGNRRTEAFLRSAPADRPLAVQIDAATPDEARDAVAILEARGADAVDINMGCPVRKLARKGKGAALARSADEAAAVARAAVEAARRIPVTAKMRLGWDEGDLTAPDLARALEAAGVAAVAVHGRRRAQCFRGTVDRAGIRAVVRATSIPVLGNGDIDSPRRAPCSRRQAARAFSSAAPPS